MLAFRLVLSMLIFYTLNTHATDLLYWGDYGGRLISQSGKIDHDLTLLKMKQKAGLAPPIIVGGDSILVARAPKLENRPLYLFDQLSAELQNVRAYLMANISEYGLAQVAYQVNSDIILDGFVTLGNLDKSPFFLTVGRQYIPYGDFNKFEAEVNPLNKTLFRIDQDAVTAGIYDVDTLVRLSVVDNDSHYRRAVAISIRKELFWQQTDWMLGGGFITSANGMTKPLKTLEIGKNAIPVADIYMIARHFPWLLRVEFTQALNKFSYSGRLGAYNVDSQYVTQWLNKPIKVSVAVSGLYNQGQIMQDFGFKRLGLFTQQFVLSVKRPISKHIFLGFSALTGRQENWKSQVVFDVVIKV